MAYENIVYEVKEAIATITFNRPKALNALNGALLAELSLALDAIAADEDIRVLVLTGAGDKSFNAGGDVEGEKEDSQVVFEETPSIHAHLRLVGKPVIAVVKGYCIGMGNHLAYHCDLTIAADNAIFGQVGPRVGSPAGGAPVAYLARIVGHKKAREMWMLCRRYNAQEALQMGLINAVVPLEQADEEAEKWAQELLGMNPTCLQIIKSSYDDELENMPHGDAYFANLISPQFFGGEEQLEAMNAFLEKRKPDWGKILRERPTDFT